ncbi:hypothetical protein RF11_04598 [Thelohanellus kitauei]|uniref:Uncharacterized protein n=1 Tax=Thelohanellus kitauei TaxID=669202 RepID=A0A0C2IVF8_THEKT|nr:hypothetical protein RF11_04598 [Thelohanellus kitauei]
MLIRLRFLDEIVIDINELFNVVINYFNQYVKKYRLPQNMSNVAKIMSAFLNVSTNKIQVDSIEKLINLGGIFSVNLINYLTKIESRSFKLTKNKKQMLYIIYLTLIALPMLNKNKYKRLISFLTLLHDSFDQYFKKCSINDIPIEHQLLILQCYIKCPIPDKFEPSQYFAIFQNLLASLKSNPCYSNIL